MIIYLHGFRSSPHSTKAQLLAQAIGERSLENDWACPQLPASPAQAVALVHGLIEKAQERGQQADRTLTLIGSSLGGYYAACLAARWNCRAVLLNPVVHGARDLATQVGTHTQYHSDQPFVFLPGYVQELAEMAVDRPTHPENCFLLVTTGDEVLNWRETVQWYAGCPSRIVSGSDHGISDFNHWLPEVLEFALRPPITQL